MLLFIRTLLEHHFDVFLGSPTLTVQGNLIASCFDKFVEWIENVLTTTREGKPWATCSWHTMWLKMFPVNTRLHFADIEQSVDTCKRTSSTDEVWLHTKLAKTTQHECFRHEISLRSFHSQLRWTIGQIFGWQRQQEEDWERKSV